MKKLHIFSTDQEQQQSSVIDTFLEDASSLRKFESETREKTFRKLVELTLQLLTGTSPENYLEGLGHHPSRFLRFLLTLYQHAVKHKVSEQQLIHDLKIINSQVPKEKDEEEEEDGEEEKEQQRLFQEKELKLLVLVWRTKFLSLQRTMLKEGLLKVNQLKDMDWNFGITIANSEVKKIGKTHLKLKFVVESNSGEEENVYFEMTLPQFYNFLSKMEEAKACLDFFTN